MIQDISPKKFFNSFSDYSPKNGDTLLVFQGEKALLAVEDNRIAFPILGNFPGILPEDCRFLFRIDNQNFVLPYRSPSLIPSGFNWYSSGEYRRFSPRENLFACAAGHSLYRWYQDNRFCGRCGSEMKDSQNERALVCPNCGSTRYPKICPAVIVAVRNGNKLLVTRYKDRPYRGPALIAGFTEIGESVEETVHREVMEEAGLSVKNLTFYKSQPWVITDSLLLGFFCDLEGSNAVRLQEDELSCAEWLDRKDVPPDSSHVSLTAEMMEAFRSGRY